MLRIRRDGETSACRVPAKVVRAERGGAALMFASLGQQNIRSMLLALTIALLGAAVVLGAVLRSARIAWVGLVCNMLPILLVYAVWAVANGQISIGAAVVMGMILGICRSQRPRTSSGTGPTGLPLETDWRPRQRRSRPIAGGRFR